METQTSNELGTNLNIIRGSQYSNEDYSININLTKV